MSDIKSDYYIETDYLLFFVEVETVDINGPVVSEDDLVNLALHVCRFGIGAVRVHTDTGHDDPGLSVYPVRELSRQHVNIFDAESVREFHMH